VAVVVTRVGALKPLGAIQDLIAAISEVGPSPLKLVAETLKEYLMPGSRSVTKNS
jgi:hypothetical protein